MSWTCSLSSTTIVAPPSSWCCTTSIWPHAIPMSSLQFLAGRSSRMGIRSEEHTSELQSRGHLVCRLLLEKKNKSVCDTVSFLCLYLYPFFFSRYCFHYDLHSFPTRRSSDLPVRCLGLAH